MYIYRDRERERERKGKESKRRVTGILLGVREGGSENGGQRLRATK